MRDALAALLVREPVLGLFIKRCWIYAANIEAPIATDGLRIFVNPSLFSLLRESEQVYMLAHVAMHMILKHPTRGGALEAHYGVSREVVNYAADVKANQHLAETSVAVPRGEPSVDEAESLVPGARRMSFEELALALWAKKGGVSPRRLDLGVYGAGGEVLNEGDLGDLEAGSVYEIERRVEEKFVEVATGAKLAGWLPGWAERLIGGLYRPLLDWRKLLRAALTRGAGRSLRRIWARPSRKNELFPGKQLMRVRRVAVFVDTSGSIDGDTLMRFLSEVYAAAEEAELAVVPWDAVPYGVYIVKRRDDLKKIEVMGGGGTRLAPALALLEGELRGVDKVVIFSDWNIADIDEAEPLLRRHASKIVAVTTDREPPGYLQTIYLPRRRL